MIVTALDPGGTTGWASTHVVPPDHVEVPSVAEIGPGYHHRTLHTWLRETAPDVVVCESFQFRQFASTTKAKVNLASPEYIGIARLYAAEYEETSLVMQSSSQVKGFSTDEKLRMLGWYVKGKPHARDATRHLLYYLVVRLQIRGAITDAWRSLYDDPPSA